MNENKKAKKTREGKLLSFFYSSSKVTFSSSFFSSTNNFFCYKWRQRSDNEQNEKKGGKRKKIPELPEIKIIVCMHQRCVHAQRCTFFFFFFEKIIIFIFWLASKKFYKFTKKCIYMDGGEVGINFFAHFDYFSNFFL